MPLIFQKYVWQDISSHRSNRQHYPYLHTSLGKKDCFMASCVFLIHCLEQGSVWYKHLFGRGNQNTSFSLLCPTMLGFSAKHISVNYLRAAVTCRLAVHVTYQGQDTIHTPHICLHGFFSKSCILHVWLTAGQVQMQR